MRFTKIVATLGPATTTPERIEELISAGMNVARLNFSHGSHEEHAQRLRTVREVAQRLDKAVAILLDLQGPKIRTGSLERGEPVLLEAGQEFTITTRPVTGTKELVSTTYDMLPIDVRTDNSVLLSDGLIELRVMRTTSTDVITEVVHGGELREHQGINLPGVWVSAPAVTKKDVEDLLFGLEMDVDYIAISFVRTPTDVQRVKDLIKQAGKHTPVIAKIERPEAVEVLPDILAVTDGVMVARGDLGVEMPAAQVPIIQKQIIEQANRQGLPVITATQMLESMIQNPRPTRAEATDVANAIIDGTDAVMLSGETAKGKYPIEAVQTMALIAETTEASGRVLSEDVTHGLAALRDPTTPVAIAAAAAAIVKTMPIKAIVVFTTSGTTAKLVSQQRPGVPIFAFTETPAVYRQLALLWGIVPIHVKFADTVEQFEQDVQRILLERGFAQEGDLAVMTGGHPIAKRGPTNFLKIVRI
ncbi:MAG: pyruvate kinase [Chloroflexaceae bacterium]|nr:pyruvate kinase [Chloroflexaceae bacterium]NJO05428.1 pyruvate kinase [Chloroflexaceae bacterium]